MSFNAKNVINGTWGTVWLDGEEIGEMKSFQAKDEYQKEGVSQCGKMSTGYKITGVDGKGSMSFHKVNSRIAKKIGKQVREGKTPTFSFISKLADPDALGYERISYTGVVFDDLTLADFEVKVLGSVETPFSYEDYTFLDEI